MTGTRARPWLALAFLPVLLAGCRDDITEVALVVQSDLDVPADVEIMDVSSVVGPFAPQVNPFFVTGVALTPFPLSVGFESGGITTTFSVTVRLFKGVSPTTGTPQLLASRTVTDIRFVPGQTMMMLLPLNRVCACQGTSCPSVGDPECDNIDRPTLQPFDPAVAPPSSSLGGTGTGGVGGTPTRPPSPQGTAAN